MEYLEIILDIFENISQKSLCDCEKLIENILQASNESYFPSNMLETGCETSNIFFLKVLLKVYEELLLKYGLETSHLSFKNILQTMNNFMYEICKGEGSLKYNLVQDQLHIITSLYNIAFFIQQKENFTELAKYYYNNLQFIHRNYKTHSISMILYSLKGTYDNLVACENDREHNVKLFCNLVDDLKGRYHIDEQEVFKDLILYGNYDIIFETLLFVLPSYLKFSKSNNVILTIWKEISILINQNKIIQNSNLYLVMCYLFNLCFTQNIVMEKEHLMTLIFEDKNYWKLIQIGLSEKKTAVKKQSMHLFQKTIDLLEVYDKNLLCYCENNFGQENINKTIVWWDTNKKNHFASTYKDLIIILEFLDEQQVHIIKPAFKMVDTIVKRILKPFDNNQSMDFQWIILIYQLALSHESTQVIKWALHDLLKLPENFFSENYIVFPIVTLLVPTLNNAMLYCNEGLSVSKQLSLFFNKFTELNTSNAFFSLIIKTICNMTWSPEALFFLIHALAQTSKNSYWGEGEIEIIKKFVANAFRTYNKIIRFGIKHEFLNSIFALTNESSVSLETMILLVSSFAPLKFKKNKNVWDKLIIWIRNSYSLEEAKKCLEKHSTEVIKNKSNNRPLILMLFVFFEAYNEILAPERMQRNLFVTNTISQVFLSFKNIDKRSYYDNMLQDYYLSIICHFVEDYLSDEFSEGSKLINNIVQFLPDILLYIQIRIKQVSKLQDYYNATLYISTLENILKLQLLHEVYNETSINKLFIEVVSNLEKHENCIESLPSIQIYCWARILKVIFKLFSPEMKTVNSNFLSLYFMKSINEPLVKDSLPSDKTVDFITLWGKINSEYLKEKWYALQSFTKKTKLMFDFKDNWFKSEDIINRCKEALTIGGYGILPPIISILSNVLFECNESTIKNIIDSLWKIVMERRKTDEFKLYIKLFVEMIFQESMMKKPFLKETLLEYSNLLFLDYSVSVTKIFIQHIQSLGLENNIHPLFCHILAKGLIFGPVQRKDEKLTAEVCSHIESLTGCQKNEYNNGSEIRGRAVQMILTLDKNLPHHQTFAWELIQNLINMENDLNKNKTRYFGDSHVHRIKHRLMQSLLLLEPLVGSNEGIASNLSKWLYDGLISENSQPSVKYLQEWLLIRILIKHSFLLEKFWNYFSDTAEIKTKGICSMISVLYHLCLIVPCEITSLWISTSLTVLIPYCMDQHFEVRLWAQVVIDKLYKTAENRKLQDIVQKFYMINTSVNKSIKRGCKGNAGKNCVKLQEDFYLNIFHPLKHYSLETIYFHLPRLANVSCDEWISYEVFKKCGINDDNVNIALENIEYSLKDIQNAKWSLNNLGITECTEFNVNVSEKFTTENYQKKMIPSKYVIPGFDEIPNIYPLIESKEKKSDLIVVASLIDRPPNLGGLARTCEIFGVSEFILSSLKVIENKQFTSLSVTAEKWLTLKEVKPQNLTTYIIEMKKSGYSIMGAEQALHSQSLNEVKFPKKTLLLLGNEKEGIPPNLLPLLDICIEIPQSGVIRSLNVHVTGALFIWEYTKQNIFCR